jgi:predicted TIM-barrel fold metal-dependent hydrolase
MSADQNVIDADGHICEPRFVWTDYAEKKYRDDVLQLRKLTRPYEELFYEGHAGSQTKGPGNPARACVPGGLDPARNVTWDDILPGSWDPAARLKVMEEEGIDQALFFPSIYLLWGDIQNAKVAAATCRAYNNWMGDFCKHQSDRLFGMGIIPLQDVEEAITETARIAKLGLRGIIVRPERFHGLALFDEKCDRLWATAQDLNLSVGVHGSFGSDMESFASGRYDENMFFEHMVAHPFGQMAAVMDFVAGGVLQKFPNLRVGFFESGLAWLPYWLDRLDEHFEVMGHVTPWLTERPSDLFKRQCFVSMEAEEGEALSLLADRGLLDCVLWGSDYPHFDSTYPGAYRDAAATFTEIGDGTGEAVVGRNPKRFMALD